jgi:hypothetical protein
VSIAPAPGMVRFGGNVTVFFIAICRLCDTALPFPNEDQRLAWAKAHHAATRHTIELAVDVRHDPRQIVQQVVVGADRRPAGIPWHGVMHDSPNTMERFMGQLAGVNVMAQKLAAGGPNPPVPNKAEPVVLTEKTLNARERRRQRRASLQRDAK